MHTHYYIPQRLRGPRFKPHVHKGQDPDRRVRAQLRGPYLEPWNHAWGIGGAWESLRASKRPCSDLQSEPFSPGDRVEPTEDSEQSTRLGSVLKVVYQDPLEGFRVLNPKESE